MTSIHDIIMIALRVPKHLPDMYRKLYPNKFYITCQNLTLFHRDKNKNLRAKIRLAYAFRTRKLQVEFPVLKNLLS